MEQPDIEVKDIQITDNDFKIIYENDAIEIIEKSQSGYKKLFDAWLLEQPMFISDIYKTQMRDLNFASRGNETSINQLNSFFKEENKNEVIKFISYMRKRDLTFEKQKWIKIGLNNNSL